MKRKLVKEFGGQCKICNYDRCVENMVFHHLDPSKKDFAISASGSTISYKKAKAEAEKCILLCCRCHGEVHAGLVSIPESYKGITCDCYSRYEGSIPSSGAIFPNVLRHSESVLSKIRKTAG